MKSNNALIVILGTVTLDAVGIGLVMPVLPGLLRDNCTFGIFLYIRASSEN